MEASILQLAQLATGGTVRSNGPSRKRKEEKTKIEDIFDAEDYTLVEYYK